MIFHFIFIVLYFHIVTHIKITTSIFFRKAKTFGCVRLASDPRHGRSVVRLCTNRLDLHGSSSRKGTLIIHGCINMYKCLIMLNLIWLIKSMVSASIFIELSETRSPLLFMNAAMLDRYVPLRLPRKITNASGQHLAGDGVARPWPLPLGDSHRLQFLKL